MYCAHCGEKILENAKFCKNCGKEVSSHVGTNTVSNKKTKQTPIPKSVGKKLTGIVLAILSFLLSVAFLGGILGILLGVAVATWCLKHFGVVSADSAWVSETKGVRRAKYILLAFIILVALIGVGYAIFNQ